MKKLVIPQKEVFWFLKKKEPVNQLRGTLETDVVIIGGGMAGLTAAQQCHAKGLRTAVVEQYLCGGGASGRSSGFITPNAELGLTHFVNLYGAEKAHAVWEFVTAGVNHIQDTIDNYQISCDYVKNDCLVVANSQAGFEQLRSEHDNYKKLNYASNLYSIDEIRHHVNSPLLHGGMRFWPTFGIHAYAYLQGLQKVLSEKGVQIFEETPALKINKHSVETEHGTIKANYIIACADRFAPKLNVLTEQVFQVQTFLMMSNPLEEKTIKQIFPNERFMVWDTDFIYQYYRLSGDNRLMLGGSTYWQSYSYTYSHNSSAIFRKLNAYCKRNFPTADITFEYMWPGLIGVSKDLMPLIGRDKQSPNIYYVSGATGLPWAAALGSYAVENLFDNRHDFDELFSPYRHFTLHGITQKILGKKITFALSNLKALRE